MSKQAIFITAAAIATAFPLLAGAGTNDPVVNQRQHNQHHRIAQGVKSGELTHQEAQSLRSEQRQIRTEERAYKADGNLDKAERKDLRQDVRAANRHIAAEKHDAEMRAGAQ